jgi:hypothetical protein
MIDMSETSIVTLMGAHTDVREWPARTTVACWNCCHQFDGVPIPAPWKLERGKLARCSGVFCSFNCAKRHIQDKNLHRGWEAMSMLSLLHKRMVGSTVNIRLAPPRMALTMFGGTMSIEEYRHGSLSLPPTDAMYDETTRAALVTELTHICQPSFPRILIQRSQVGTLGGAMGETVQGSVQHERNAPLRTATLHSTMGMNVSLARGEGP